MRSSRLRIRLLALARGVTLLGAGGSVVLAVPVSAMCAPQPDPEAERATLEKQSGDAFARKDYKAAEAALRRLTVVDADNFVPWYNLACALCVQGRTEEAGPALERAIELGFSDLQQLQSDPYLAALRRTENYKRLTGAWNEILGANIDQRLQAARKQYGPSYTIEKDAAHRLAYVSAFPEASFAQAKQDIGRLIDWWGRYVCDPAPATDGADSQVPWVMVVLPSPADYAKWARSKYGDGWERVGGVYSHDAKTLTAKDLGSTLRHEFWHVLHWRHMDVLRQRHPVWIMEGLCSLMEDVEVSPDGSARPIPSWRTNQAGNLARAGRTTPWETLFTLDQKRFVGVRPLSFYGQSRAIFMWLAREGKLKAWYSAYTAGYKEDPSGLAAFAQVFGKPVQKVEADFKVWLRAIPVVDEDFPVGSAVLPFDVQDGGGDGLLVAPSPDLDRLGARPTANFSRSGGIRPRDVITAIDGQPVTETGQLIRVLADYGPDTEVTVTFRRGRNIQTTKVTLIEKR